ncbi:hypothetical protein D3OALGA1CA_4158 [Olavius algarvensis associated proteobacterium Delta 3]|nr:hypothetical protein D3OALGB2SA_814 [Olavius algarvensis associated proteobacterium Delta 3]CAB5146322.1 hypothetical protein D3OALGA1CA_4158 [Olavius algarvensis associated proteobacterium Delta 3]
MNASERRKLDIFQEEAKASHTTHWDWDYMTDAQIENWMAQQRRAHVSRRRKIMLAMGLGIAGVLAAGLLVFHGLVSW